VKFSPDCTDSEVVVNNNNKKMLWTTGGNRKNFGVIKGFLVKIGQVALQMEENLHLLHSYNHYLIVAWCYVLSSTQKHYIICIKGIQLVLIV